MIKNFIFGIFLMIAASASAANAQTDVRTVEKVDLKQYVGKWFEIASIPQSFQKKCVANVTADYSVNTDGYINVINSCLTAKGEAKVAKGAAKIIDTNSNAKLKVTFVKLVKWVFAFGGDYWVIDLANDYRYAVVGHPTREYGWILSRTPNIAVEDLKTISENLKLNGYDTCQFITTVQKNGLFSEKKPLCQAF
jgi:apolipoprotein D and lipocalin family protein